MNPNAVIGRPFPQLNAESKVKGNAAFCDDLWFPKMLYCRILRSPHAHARILEIDTSEAESLPGVKAVITAGDTPRIPFVHVGGPFQDKLPLQDSKVRYVGDEVAAVAALREDIAETALRLIRVKYEVLPAVFDPEEALGEDAPQVHDGKNNALIHIKRDFGNAERALEESDLVLEDVFETQAVSHCNLEPRCSVAMMDEQGVLKIWTSTQSPHYVRKEVSHVLGLPLTNVRVMEIHVGGGFGSRSKVCEDEAITAMLALKTGRPVKIAYSREEEFTATRIRMPFKIWIKQGVTNDGTLTARKMKVIADKGAYAHYGPAVLGYAAGVSCALYRVPNVKYDGYLVYTNKHFAGPFRGFGAPQVTFAIESQIDRLAENLGMDGMALRLKNANQPNETTTNGWRITSCGFSDCIRKAAETSGWAEKKKARAKGNSDQDTLRGIGMACGIHLCGAKIFADGDYSGAIVKVFEDGQVTLYKGNTDMGTWSNTTAAQIVAEEIGIDLDRVRVISMDTETTPTDSGSFASRVLFIHGNAAKKAAAKAKASLLKSAAAVLGETEKDLFIESGAIAVTGNPEKRITIGEAVKQSAEKVCDFISCEYHYDPPSEPLNFQTGYSNISAAYTFTTQVAEVEVDRSTGLVSVQQFVVAQDVGKAINPLAVEGQIEGAVAQGIGYALSEGYHYQDGFVLNANFTDYSMPGIQTLPKDGKLKVILVETDDPEGPFGAKGAGELTLNPTAAAVANAVYDATGIRCNTLPITPEQLAARLEEKAHK